MGEQTERSFVMIKPDGVKRGLTDEVVKRLTDAGLIVVFMAEPLIADSAVVTKHYPIDEDYLLTFGHRDPSGWSEEEKRQVITKNHAIVLAMHEFIMSGPVVPMIIEGPVGTVAKVREIVGKTNPADAAPGTIRGDFGEDSFAATDAYLAETGKSRPVYNIVHASGSPEEAEAEIANWLPEHVR